MPIKRAPPPRSKIRTRKKPEQVGYKKPPKHSQFKPGQSGNPKGRPKGARNQDTIVTEIMSCRLEDLKKKDKAKLSNRELVIMKLLEKALKGDQRAIDKVLDLDAKIQAKIAEANNSVSKTLKEIDEHDKAMLADLFPGSPDTEGSET